jgi:hypothetical protein
VSLELLKIGDPTVESPKDFPVLHDSNIDKLEIAFQQIDTANASNISLINTLSEDLVSTQQMFGAFSNDINANSSLISNVSSLVDVLQQTIDDNIQTLFNELNDIGVKVVDLELLSTSLQDDFQELDMRFSQLNDGYFETEVFVLSGSSINIGNVSFTDIISGGTKTVTGEFLKLNVNGSPRWIQLFS